MKINKRLSRKMAAIVNSYPRACFRNAALGVLNYKGNALYVQGHAIPDTGLPVEHAWIDCAGQIVDPTYYSDGYALDMRAFDVKYFPGISLSRDEVFDILETQKGKMIIDGLWEIEAYQESYLAAMEAAFGPDGRAMVEKTWKHNRSLYEQEKEET